jgi:hypothetical protein
MDCRIKSGNDDIECRAKSPAAANYMTTVIPQERLRSLIHRHEAVTAMLAAGPKRDEYVRLSRELAELDPVAEKARALADAEAELPKWRR